MRMLSTATVMSWTEPGSSERTQRFRQHKAGGRRTRVGRSVGRFVPAADTEEMIDSVRVRSTYRPNNRIAIFVHVSGEQSVMVTRTTGSGSGAAPPVDIIANRIQCQCTTRVRCKHRYTLAAVSRMARICGDVHVVVRWRVGGVGNGCRTAAAVDAASANDTR